MDIITENEGLKELLETGCSKRRELKNLPKGAIKGFVKAVMILRTENRIEDLYKYHGLNYERLKGRFKEYESVRCDSRYRLIFKSSLKESIDEEGNAIQVQTITEVNLIKISDHYDDI